MYNVFLTVIRVILYHSIKMTILKVKQSNVMLFITLVHKIAFVGLTTWGLVLNLIGLLNWMSKSFKH